MLSDEIKKTLAPIYKLRYMALFTSILTILVGLISPFLMSQLIDEITSNYTGYTTNIHFMIGSIVGLYIFSFILNYISRYTWINMEKRGAGMVRAYIFKNVLHKNYRFFMDHPIGDINSKVINDSYLYAKYKISAMPMIALNLLQMLVVIIVLFNIEFHMAGATIAFSFIFFIVQTYLNKNLRHTTKKERESFSNLTNIANETLMGINTIQLYTVEDYFAKRFEKEVDKYEHLLLKHKVDEVLVKLSTTTFVGFMTIVAILVGLFFAEIGDVSIGSIVAFYLFLPYLSSPIKELTEFNISLQTANAVKERLEELITKEVRVDNNLEKIDKIEQVEFKDLSFSYNNKEFVLDNINITLNKGDSVAVVGRSGKGKTTLLRLLKKQIEPTHGEILINGKNKTQIDRQSYINRIAVLSQEIFIFDSSLHDNIALGKDYPEKTIRDAATYSCIDHFSMDESSFGLSGGERQRVALARALACDFDVLILDEPTSEIDQKTEDKIIDNLKRLQAERQFIMIVVTHSENLLEKLCDKRLHL